MPSLPWGGHHVCVAGKSVLPHYLNFFPYKSEFYGHGGVTDVSKSLCRPARPWERGFAAPERGHGQGRTFVGPFPLRPSPGGRHGATRATSIPGARSRKPAPASSGDAVARKTKGKTPSLQKSPLRPQGSPRSPVTPGHGQRQHPPHTHTHVEVDDEEKCYLWHVAHLCAIHSFFWLEILFRLCRGVLRRASKGPPSSPHRHLRLVFIF